jgi:GNAT superfamily N-acetyltransferase
MDLRMRVLRPLHPAEMCRYPEDNLATTFHLGIFLGGKVICNGTFMQQACAQPELANAKLPYRLRGMATDPGFQGQGYGREIILAAEKELAVIGADLLWFNARVSAENFYAKLGYKVVGEIFDIDTIGAHKIMYKLF